MGIVLASLWLRQDLLQLSISITQAQGSIQMAVKQALANTTMAWRPVSLRIESREELLINTCGPISTHHVLCVRNRDPKAGSLPISVCICPGLYICGGQGPTPLLFIRYLLQRRQGFSLVQDSPTKGAGWSQGLLVPHCCSSKHILPPRGIYLCGFGSYSHVLMLPKQVLY